MGMSKALASLTQLQRLHLQCNGLRQEYFSLGGALGNMQQLRELEIDERLWPPEVTPKLECLPDHLAQLSQLQVLHLSMPLPVNRLASMLACLTALQDLHFRVSSCSGSSSNSDDDGDDDGDDDERDDGDIAELAPALLAMPELRVLGYVCRDMVQGMRMVQQLTGLQDLVLQGSRFNSPDAEAGLEATLLQLNRLTSLDLSYCTYWSGTGPGHLQGVFKQLPQLQHLDNSHNQIFCSNYATLLGSRADLQLVRAAQNEGVLAAALQHLTGLQHLNVSAMHFMLLRDRLQGESLDDCTGLLAALQRMKGLRHLDISLVVLKDDRAPALAQALECTTSLECLYMAANGFTQESAAVLADALSKLQRLRHLCAGHNAWGLQGAVALMSHLAELPHLRMLDLDHSNYSDSGSADCNSADSWAQLLPCLKRFKSLCHLNIRDNVRDNKQASALLGTRLAAAMGTSCEYVRV